ncbi:lanthionine synthetase C family protein [Spongiimicrobium salis]|uniref:lanthionine synthetase C family protein n=1 Tax=Spongiimicrobium salis TaxID=1667022 RepID=UPI00374CA1FA
MTNIPDQKQKVQEIDRILRKEYKRTSDIGIMTGISGIALFQFYYSRYIDSNECAEIATEMIVNGIEKINNGYDSPSYSDGIAGLCWVVQHLKINGFLDVDTDAFLSPFDEYLYAQMRYELKLGNFDFLHGALGYGFYFLSRYDNTSDLHLKKKYEKYLLSLVTGLENSMITEGKTFKWESTLNVKTGVKGFDLGLSHGIASIINFLSRLHQFEVFKKSTEKLLKGSIAFVLSTESDKKTSLSLFPSAIEKEKSIQYNSRISWCYGDLGIGLSLLRASKVLKDGSLKQKAYTIFKHTAERKTPQDTLVRDAGVCHGSFGNALMYQNISGRNKLFQRMSEFWLGDGMQKAVYKDGYAGYKQWCNSRKTWISQLSLLEGIAGIGLTIINYLSKKRFKWDECLLIS